MLFLGQALGKAIAKQCDRFVSYIGPLHNFPASDLSGEERQNTPLAHITLVWLALFKTIKITHLKANTFPAEYEFANFTFSIDA